MLAPIIRALRNFLIIVVVTLAVWLLPGAISTAQDYAIPTVGVTWENQYGQIPDWSQLTFRTLPPILSDGVFDAPSEMNDALNYDLSRVWQAGQTADTYLKLGDFQTSLYLQLFNLYSVAQLTQLGMRIL